MQLKKKGTGLEYRYFSGWEFTYNGNGEDYLTYGLDESFLYDNHDCGQWEISRYADAVHNKSGILIRAHPFRMADYIKNPCIIRPGIADVIEVFNGGNGDRAFDEKALQYAIKNDLPMSSGSDAHHVDTAAQGYVGFERKMDSCLDLCHGLIRHKARLYQKTKRLTVELSAK